MEITQSDSKTLKVMLIDFNPVVREGLQAILAKDKGIEVVGDAPDGHHALLDIRQTKKRGQPVNVVLTETKNGEVDGVQATRLIKDEFPDTAVLVLTERSRCND